MNKIQLASPSVITAARRLICLCVCMLPLLHACTESANERMTKLEREGETCFQNHDYQCAVDRWERFVELGGKDAEVDFRLGLAYRYLGNLSAALEMFRESVKKAPNYEPALKQEAELEIFFMDIPSASNTLARLDKLGRSAGYYILAGDLLSIQGKYRDAEEQYRTLLSIEPENPRGLIRLAYCLISQDKDKESYEVYKKLENIESLEPGMLASLGRYWFIRGDREKAQEFLEKAVKNAADDVEMRVRLARFFMECGNYEKAASIFSEIFTGDPENSFARKMLIELRLLSGDLAGAKKILDAVPERDSMTLEYELLFGKYYLLTYNFPQAVSYFQQAIEEEPDLVLGHYLLGLTYLAMGHGNLGKSSLVKALALDKSFTNAELALADYFYKHDNYDIADKYALRVIEKEPGNVRAFMILGAASYMRGDLKRSAGMFRIGSRLDPESLIPACWSAQIYKKAGDYVNALTLYRQLTEQCRECMDVAYDYAMLLADRDRDTEALSWLRQLAEDMPDNPWPLCIMGELHMRKGRIDAAESAFNDALSLKPGLRFAYDRLMKIMKSKGDEAGLQKIFDNAVSAGATYPELYISLASLYHDKGQVHEAVKLLEKAREEMPGNPYIANNLACYLEESPDSDIARAFDLALEANEQLPDNPAVMDTLAWIYYRKGLYTQAHWLLEACLEKDKENALVHYHLGMVYAAEKRFRQAREHLLPLVRSQSSLAVKARQALEEIKKQEADATRQKQRS